MALHPRPFAFFACLLLVVTGCGDDGVDVEERFDLTFQGDASFQGAHGGQAIEAALVDATGNAVATRTGTVSATADPSFSFQFDEALEAGSDFQLHFWIDSNFNGGTADACDPPANDHQWSIDIADVSDDVVIADTHRPGETTSVCDTF